MNRTELDRIFSQEVATYMMAGYVIDTYNQAGHQGEIAKVRLYNGDHMVQILMDRDNDWREGKEYVIITVGEQVKKVNRVNSMHTEWNGDYNTIREYRYINLNSRYYTKPEWYVTEEEYNTLKDVALSRRVARREAERHIACGYIEDASMKELALKIVRKQPRCKSAKMSDVRIFKTIYPHYVEYDFMKGNKEVFNFRTHRG